MSSAANPTPRRTLPAPNEPINVEQLIADRQRLLAERDELLARLEAREAAAREVVFLVDEVARLREELARYRNRTAAISREEEPTPIPRPAPVPRTVGNALYANDAVPTGGPRAVVPNADGGLDFGSVSRLSPVELDKLPYGLICLDAQGRVVHYNDTEARLARLPKERVIGRNFFGEVAPCARVREFEGEFKELVRDPSAVRVRSFDFIFRFSHSEQHVTIVMTPARQRGLYNIALLRRNITKEG